MWLHTWTEAAQCKSILRSSAQAAMGCRNVALSYELGCALPAHMSWGHLPELAKNVLLLVLRKYVGISLQSNWSSSCQSDVPADRRFPGTRAAPRRRVFSGCRIHSADAWWWACRDPTKQFKPGKAGAGHTRKRHNRVFLQHWWKNKCESPLKIV